MCCFGNDGVVANFSFKKASDKIKFQNASKRPIKIIYLYAIRHRTRLSQAIHRPIL